MGVYCINVFNYRSESANCMLLPSQFVINGKRNQRFIYIYVYHYFTIDNSKITDAKANFEQDNKESVDLFKGCFNINRTYRVQDEYTLFQINRNTFLLEL